MSEDQDQIERYPEHVHAAHIKAHRDIALVWRERAEVATWYIGMRRSAPFAREAHLFMKDREAAHSAHARKALWELLDAKREGTLGDEGEDAQPACDAPSVS